MLDQNVCTRPTGIFDGCVSWEGNIIQFKHLATDGKVRSVGLMDSRPTKPTETYLQSTMQIYIEAAPSSAFEDMSAALDHSNSLRVKASGVSQSL